MRSMKQHNSVTRQLPFCGEISERGAIDLDAGMTDTALEPSKVVLKKGDGISDMLLVRRGSQPFIT